MGVPLFWLSEEGHPPKMTTYDCLWPPPHFSAKSFSTQKMGIFPKKTRAPYLEKWPSYGHVKFEKRNLKISEKLARLTKIAITPSIFEISSIFFAYGHWWPPLKVPCIILHKICFAGPSEAVKQVRVKLTPFPVLWREKRPPCGIGLKRDLKQKIRFFKKVYS